MVSGLGRGCRTDARLPPEAVQIAEWFSGLVFHDQVVNYKAQTRQSPSLNTARETNQGRPISTLAICIV